MKIVHFAKFYPPEYGGIESVTEALSEDHAAAGHDVEVVCFTRDVAQVENQGKLTLNRVKAITEKSSQPLSMSYLGTCSNAARSAEVVHVHTPNILASLAVLRVPRDVCVVVHWHADIEGKGFLGHLVRPIEQAMLRRADRIVTTTEAYAIASPALSRFIEKINVIPIGITNLTTPITNEQEPEAFALFVGRLVPYKGLPVLLDAIALMKNRIEFRIVGIGPEENSLRQQVHHLRIADRVKFLGRVEQNQLETLFSKASLFCLPSVSRLEAFGVVLLEAMRSGCAIVATNIVGSGVPWVNANGINVPVSDPIALANALDDLLDNSEKRRKHGDAARERFECEFTREKMSSRFLKLYGNLTSMRINPSTSSSLDKQ